MNKKQKTILWIIVGIAYWYAQSLNEFLIY